MAETPGGYRAAHHAVVLFDHDQHSAHRICTAWHGQMYSNISLSKPNTVVNTCQYPCQYPCQYGMTWPVNHFPIWFCQGACPNGPGARFEQRGWHVCPSSWTRRSQNYFGWSVLERTAGCACGSALQTRRNYLCCGLRVGWYRSC